MKIVLFSDTFKPDINGVSTSTETLGHELRKHGHEVLIVTTSLPKGSDYKDTYPVARVKGIDCKWLYGYRFTLPYSRRIIKQLNDFQPDLIHIETEFGMGIFGKIMAYVYDIPLVYTYHTMYADYCHYLNPRNIDFIERFLKWIVKVLSKLYGDHVDALVTPTIKSKHVLDRYNIDNKIYVVSTGLRLSRFSKDSDDHEFVEEIKNKYHLHNKFVVSYIGRIASEKSIDFIIKSFVEVKKRSNDIVLMIVGGGPQIDELKQLSKTLGLEDTVIFTGLQENSTIASFYHASDVFVSASLSETQGLTYIEAMASHIPILARYDENLEGVVKEGKNGYFFRDEEELVRLIIDMSRSDLDEMCQFALADSRNYGSEAFYNNMMKVYEEAMEKHYNCYKIVKIAQGKVTFACKNHEVTIELSDHMIKQYMLKEGLSVDYDMIESLRDQNKAKEAYNKALNYLTYKDYTYKMMKEKLSSKMELSDIQLDMAMNYLEKKKFIDDRTYTQNYITQSQEKKIGINKIVNELKNRGVSPFIIEECLEDYDYDKEYQQALSLVDKMYKENNKYSINELKNKMRNRLYQRGYNQELIEQVVNDFEFNYPPLHTYNLLKKEYAKIYNRYSKRYEGDLLKQKIITFLVSKGYDYDEIVNVVEEENE